MNHEQLKQAAEAALKKWLHPQPVKGTSIELCYVGRIQRAMEHGSVAMQNNDKEALEKIKKAIDGLETMATEAGKLASEAQQAYKAATGESVTVEPCWCEYCQKEQQLDMVWQAESRLRRSIFELVEPAVNGMPKPLALLRSGDEDGLKNLVASLCDAQAGYFDACSLYKVTPRWGDVVRTAV